ncbi:hypothetical protein KSS87_003931 [Heliosperma pusillum]|nr:hypothetical protein KSS87_003931 [Heliosperma pusillum]
MTRFRIRDCAALGFREVSSSRVEIGETIEFRAAENC